MKNHEPLKWLFRTAARAWSEGESANYLFGGLRLPAMGGATLRTADSGVNREYFGVESYASGKVASYPRRAASP